MSDAIEDPSVELAGGATALYLSGKFVQDQLSRSINEYRMRRGHALTKDHVARNKELTNNIRKQGIIGEGPVDAGETGVEDPRNPFDPHTGAKPALKEEKKRPISDAIEKLGKRR